MAATWFRCTDGTYRTDVRVTFRLDADELARLLAVQDETTGMRRTTEGIRRTVRRQLHDFGLSNLMDADADQVHRDAVAQAYGVQPRPAEETP